MTNHVLLQRRATHRIRFKITQLWLRANKLSPRKDMGHVMWLLNEECVMVEREVCDG